MHFWPDSALIYGIRVDYLSPTLYFLDLLIVFYLLVQKISHLPLKSSGWYLKSLLPFLLVNLLFSTNPLSTLSWSLHFSLYFLFLFSLSFPLIRRLAPILLLSLITQLALALIQVALGHSLQGLLYYLGERMVSVGSPNIAQAVFMDRVVLRAYGTFWLVISLLILRRLNPRRFVLAISGALTILGVFLTQSRSSALALFGIIIPFYFLRSLRSRLLYFAFFLVLSSYFLFPIFISRSDLSLTERLDLQDVSLQVIRQFPLFGTGAQASISTYPVVSPSLRLLQPDHNSFTLFLSWFGLVGVFSLLSFLTSNIYHLFPILPLLLLDHYLLTSPQGLFILLFYLALHYFYVQNHRQ
ncbi:MAG: hypothetical protein UX59_C0001G0055 [Microgenomates group bacterium GW2011_GWA1_46_7]|nr:MAG: hypothetical protein UX59_C0001G0055 [Microgenomates group bacterium GW2011_GWA1_46_7]